MGENLRVLQFADWITNKICEFAICGSIKRNLRTRISQKFADLWLRIEPKNLQIKKTVAWSPLQIYSGALGKLIHEKKLKLKISWHCPFKLSFACTKLYKVKTAHSRCDSLPTENYNPWLNLLKGRPPHHTHTHTHTSDVSIFWEWRGWISRAIPRKCSPLAQIRREQKKPGPLLLVYFMTNTHSTGPPDYISWRNWFLGSLNVCKFGLSIRLALYLTLEDSVSTVQGKMQRVSIRSIECVVLVLSIFC